MKKNKTEKAAIIGATGIIGQVFTSMLSDHDVFEIKSLIASKKRAGKRYKDQVKWQLPFAPNEKIFNMTLEELDAGALKSRGIKYIFSALPAESGNKIESFLREGGFYIFSNSSAHRRDKDVPILIPDVNPDTIELIKKQGFPDKGFIITNSNCSTSGLAIALSPLKEFGIKEVTVSTYQAISGAGYPGHSAIDISDNVIPFIKGEEEKIEFETKAILNINFDIFASSVRVPVRFGHLETVWVKLNTYPDKESILKKWGLLSQITDLPSIPKKPVIYLDDEGIPRNNLSFLGTPRGMQVFTGGLKIKGGKIGFNLLVNNVVRGGAGGSVINAEYFQSLYGENSEKDRS